MDRRTSTFGYSSPFDVVMLGTFAAWRLGTLQARALPVAAGLRRHGLRCAIVTVPYDSPEESRLIDVVDDIPIVNTGNLTRSRTPLAVLEQARVVRRFRPRLVHAFKPKGYGGLAALLARSQTTLVDLDDWEGDGGWNRQGDYGVMQRRMFDAQERHLIRTADGITAASTLLAARARRERAAPDRETVWQIPNGLDQRWYTTLRAADEGRLPSVRQAKLRILVYSRFEEFAADWLPRFVRSLGKQVGQGDRFDQPVEVVIVGTYPTGWTFQDSRDVCVKLLGYVARNHLPEILTSATVAVFPYTDQLITRSKNSVKLLELMAAGCPIIASDVGDVATTIGRSGVTVEGSDPERFARVTAELLRRPDKRSGMSLVGPARVGSSFSVDVVSERFLGVYATFGVTGR